MRATYWFIGCAVCIASVSVAATTTGDTQDMDSSAHSAVDVSSTRDGGSASGSDVFGLTHDSSPHDASVETSPSVSGSGHASGTSTTPARVHQPHVGWQSLLPGSIQ